MEKSLIINYNLLNEANISINDLIWLHSLYNNNYDKTYRSKLLEEGRFIKVSEQKDGNCKIAIRQLGITLVELCLIDSDVSLKDNKVTVSKLKSSRIIKSEVKERVSEFRELWRGLKPGAMGGKQACIDKLNKWMLINPEYIFDDIIKAAQLYLSTEGQNLRFLQRADYFIYKQDSHRNEMSRLSAFIDEIGDEKVGDWTTKLS